MSLTSTASTLSFWLKRDASTSKLFKHSSGNNNFITISSSSISHRANGTYTTYSISVPTSTWTHIVITRDGGSGKVYMDGSLEDTQTTSETYIFDEIGRGIHANEYQGNIDEVAIWDTALNGDAIKAIYNGGNPIDLTIDNGAYDEYTDNLQGYWRMGDGTLDTYPLIADQVDTTFALLRDDSFSSSAGWNGSITVADGQLTKNNTGLVYRTDISISSGDILRYVVDVETRGAGLTAYVGGTVVSIPSTGLQTIYISTSASNSFVGFNSGNGSVINSVVISKVNGNAGLMTNMASGDIEENTP